MKDRNPRASSLRVGNAPCSWGSLEFEGMEGDHIPWDRMLDELVATGYRGTELGDWGYMPTEPDRLRTELRSRQLTMLGAFVPVDFRRPGAHADGRHRALRAAHLLAAVSGLGDLGHRPFVVLADENGAHPGRTRCAGRVTPDMRLSDAESDAFARGVDAVAAAVFNTTGLECVFHHHAAGFVETPAEIDLLLSRTNPDLVGLVLDTGHYAFGAGSGEAVLDGMDRFGDRIRYVHFKDCDDDVAARSREEEWDYFTSLRHGVFCELGAGCVDFPGIVERLRGMSYEGWIVVEQDVLPGMGAPRESAARNRRYLHDIGL